MARVRGNPYISGSALVTASDAEQHPRLVL